MNKFYKWLVIVSSLCLCSQIFIFDANAGIDLPWSTTFNCNEWNGGPGSQDPYCDGISKSGDWSCTTCDPPKYEQITSAANYPLGGGGRGQRHWIGDGRNINSGSLAIHFNTPQTEWWIRFYMRHQKGFTWKDGSQHAQKILYLYSAQSTAGYIGWQDRDKVRLYVGPSMCQVISDDGNGFQTVMGGATGDGEWHLYEFHFKISNPPTIQMWIDGVLRLESFNVNWGGISSWSYFKIPENLDSADNGDCYYQDIDDIAISNTGRIGGIDGQISHGVDILFETWEQASVNNWDDDFIAGDTIIDRDPVYAGQYAIKMKSSNPGNYVHFFGDHPLLGQPSDMISDVSVEEYYYPSPGFQWPSSDMKLWIMNCFESWGAAYAMADGRVKPNSFAPYYMTISVNGNGQLFGQLTRADGLGGAGILWQNYWQNVGSPVSLTPGQFNKIKYRLKLNDLGKSNGIFQLWVNDVLKCDYSNINFRGNYPTYGWNHLMMLMYPNPSHPQNQWISRDNIRIFGSQTSFPPSPPTGLRIGVF